MKSIVARCRLLHIFAAGGIFLLVVNFPINLPRDLVIESV